MMRTFLQSYKSLNFGLFLWNDEGSASESFSGIVLGGFFFNPTKTIYEIKS